MRGEEIANSMPDLRSPRGRECKDRQATSTRRVPAALIHPRSCYFSQRVHQLSEHTDKAPEVANLATRNENTTRIRKYQEANVLDTPCVTRGNPWQSVRYAVFLHVLKLRKLSDGTDNHGYCSISFLPRDKTGYTRQWRGVWRQ